MRTGCLDPTAAEGLAALMAVQLSIEIGINQVQLEGDAKNVVDVVLSDTPDDSERGHITADIRASVRSIPAWEMKYASREANQVAHVLASLAISKSLYKVWLYDPPECKQNFFALRILT